MRKLNLVYYLIFAGLFLAFGCSQTPERKKVVEEYQRASNSRKIDSLMSLYSDNIIAEFAGMGQPLTGKAKLRGKAEYDSVLNTILAFKILTIDRDTVIAFATETNDWLKEAGLQSNTYSSYIFVIRESKIVYVRAELSDASIAAINEVMAALIPWAELNQPDRLDSLTSGTLFSFGAPKALLSLDLLRQWKLHRRAGDN
jgi:hypothetical protein